MPLHQPSGPHQSFEIVVVGVYYACVNLAASGMMAGAVHKERHVALAALVFWRTELCERLDGKLPVLSAFFAANVSLQFEQRIGYDTCRTCVFRRFLASRVVHVPQRDEVIARLAQPLDVNVSHLLREVQKHLVARIAVHHSVSVYGPRLSACPHGVVGIALMCDPLDEVAAYSVVYGHMIAAAVGSEMVEHRGLGMSHRQVVQQFVAPIPGCPEHHVEVHHVVHDGVVWPVVWLYLSRPAQQGANDGIEECGERVGRCKYHIPVFL